MQVSASALSDRNFAILPTPSGPGGTNPYTYAGMTPDKRAQSYALYFGILKCVEGINDISNNDVISGGFNGASNSYLYSYYIDPSDGSSECQTIERQAVSLWGYSSLDEALTDWGYTPTSNGGDWHAEQPGNTTGAALRSRVYGTSEPTMDGPASYLYWHKTAIAACKLTNPVDYDGATASLKSAVDSTTNREYLKLIDISPDYKKTVSNIYAIGNWMSISRALPLNSPLHSGNSLISCKDAANKANSYAPLYLAWAITHPDQAKIIDTSGTAATTEESKSSCAIDNIGWIVCPIFNFMANIIDQTYGLVANFLTVKPLTTNLKCIAASTDPACGLYNAWKLMLGFANICFVIAFLLIIYAQITGVGITNYGLKKLLPKLIVAAVLVNASYIICAIAIDISNILGSSLKSFFDSVGAGVAIPKFRDGDTTSGVGGFTGVLGPILAGAGTVYLLYANIGALLIVLPTALLSIMVAFLILIFRQAAIIILVVIAPLAFVAYLLPNTESWFKKWRVSFQTLLLMYPIIALLFGGSALASKIVMSSAVTADGNGDMFIQLLGAAISVVPLFATVFITKIAQGAGGVLGKFTGMVNNPNRGPIDRLRKRAEASADRIQNNRDIRAVGRKGIGAGSFMRRNRIAGEQKREALKKQRDAEVDNFGNLNRGVAAARSQAIMSQETAGKTGEILSNTAKLEHLEKNGALHTQAINSGLNLHNSEETHKNEATTAHMASPVNTAQYAALNRSRGENKNAQLEIDRQHEDSADGRDIARTRQDLEDRVATVKSEQVGDYKRSSVGQVNSQNRKVADKDADNAELYNNNKYLESGPGITQGRKERELKQGITIQTGVTDKIYEQSSTGQALSAAQQEIDGELKIVRDTNKNTYAAGPIGVAQAVRADAVTTVGSTTAKHVQAQALETNRDLKLEEQLRSDELDAAKAEEGALVQELRTEEGAAQHPEYGVVAEGLRAADVVKKTETQRASSAQSVANQEYAEKVSDSSYTIPGGTETLATVAGGIDPQGASRVRGIATQILTEQMGKAVGQEKSRQTTRKKDELRSEAITGLDGSGIPLTDEYRMAAAGSVAASSNMGEKIELLRQIGPALSLARADARSVNPAMSPDQIDELPEVKTLRYIQMQTYDDMREAPFGLGDRARDALQRGDWEGNFDDDFNYRIGEKLTGATLAKLKPEEISMLRSSASSFNATQKAALDAAVKEARLTPEVRKDIKPEVWTTLESIDPVLYKRP